MSNHSVACPECGATASAVIDSRNNEKAHRRRRLCVNAHRFTTYEESEISFRAKNRQIYELQAKVAGMDLLLQSLAQYAKDPSVSGSAS